MSHYISYYDFGPTFVNVSIVNQVSAHDIVDALVTVWAWSTRFTASPPEFCNHDLLLDVFVLCIDYQS